jgi:hypothetical protein
VVEHEFLAICIHTCYASSTSSERMGRECGEQDSRDEGDLGSRSLVAALSLADLLLRLARRVRV